MNVAYLSNLHRGCLPPTLPPRYAGPMSAGLPPATRQACERYVEQFAVAAGQGLGILFLGRARTWKTMAACGTAYTIWERYSIPSLFVSFPDAILDLDLNKFTPLTRRTITSWQLTPLLILDDFGVAELGKFSQTVLHGVLSYRFNACLPTLLTANITVTPETAQEQLTVAYGPLLARRLLDASAGYTVLCG